ncbi:hypothetical protein [Streptomyces sp. NBC_01361]|uniref:hypothetical protein n=1 Tax=Streptomyces sp. NBC_01361 TaxID=2903838 RepID=UPI002E364DE0|nr:hypothetical protein [Streptomyces sp. NBC_01361]
MRQLPGDSYARMRQDYGAVVPINLDPAGTENGTPALLVIGYDELRQVGGDDDLFSRDPQYWREWREGRVPPQWWLLPQIQKRNNTRFKDTPEHGPRREALIAALKQVDLKQLRLTVESYADQLIDRFCEMGKVEVIQEYARPLPLFVLAHVFGLRSPGAQGDLVDLIHQMLSGGQQAQSADVQITAILKNLVEDRSRTPHHDLASYLIQAAPGLDAEAVREDLWLMIAAGAGAATGWIANSLQQIATDRQLRSDLIGGRANYEEVLRQTMWNAPPAANVMAAFPRQDVWLGGRHVRAGEMLVLGLEGGNYDPTLLTDDRPEFVRHNRSHLGFGIGAHRCPKPAHELGELIAHVALERLWARCTPTGLVYPGEPLNWGPAFVVRQLVALDLKFAPSTPGASRPAPLVSGGTACPSPIPGPPTASPPRTSFRSTSHSAGSTSPAATSTPRGRTSRHSDRSSRWRSLIQWWRGR